MARGLGRAQAGDGHDRGGGDDEGGRVQRDEMDQRQHRAGDADEAGAEQAGDAFGAELERAAQARRRSNRTLLLALIALVAGAAASYLMYTSGAPRGLITASRQSSAPISRPPDLASPLPAATLPPPDAGAASVGNPVTAETQTLSIADQPPVASEASTLPPAAEPEIPLQVDDNLPGKQPCTAAVAALGLCNP